jgi:transposase
LLPIEALRPDVIATRETFIDIFSKKNAEELVFIDESGLHLGMTRAYGRALSHERVKSVAPFNKGMRVTMIAAIGVEEVKTALYGNWHLDGDIFVSFIKHCLLPMLQPGQTVIMDNLSTHKVKEVKELIESVKAKLVYLPVYSPDLTPIELFWSKIKSYIKKKEARSFGALGRAIKEAFKIVNGNDLEGWFEHCGYSIQ